MHMPCVRRENPDHMPLCPQIYHGSSESGSSIASIRQPSSEVRRLNCACQMPPDHWVSVGKERIFLMCLNALICVLLLSRCSRFSGRNELYAASSKQQQPQLSVPGEVSIT